MNSGNLPLYPRSPYEYIKTGEKLQVAIQRIETTPKFGINLETTGTDPHRDRIRLIQIATPHHPVLVIDLFQIPAAKWQPLKKLLQGSALKIGHTLKACRKFLVAANLGFREPYFDSELAFRIILAGRKRKASLQAVVATYLNVHLDKTEQTSNFREPLKRSQIQSAANHAEAPLKLEPHLEARLKRGSGKQWEIATQIEFPCIPVTASLELSGIQFDLKRWKEFSQQFQGDRNHALTVLKTLRRPNNHQISLLPDVTDPVNPNSQQQILPALQALGVPVQSTSGKSLTPFAEQYPVVKALLTYRHLSKLNPFDESYPSYIHPQTGRIHAEWFQIGTKTGRLSCKNPPLQTIPRDRRIRQCFSAKPGYQIIKADYSQIELRILALICQDKRLITAFQNNWDIHALTASAIFGKPINQITLEERQIGKLINFGIVYGMGAEKLQSLLETTASYIVTYSKARQFIHAFYRKHPAIKEWQDTIRRQLFQQKQYTGQTLAGRLRHWQWEKNPPINEIINYPVQGLNADIYKVAASQYLEQQRHQGLIAEIILMVHDELVLECPVEQVDAVKQLLRHCMVKAASRWLHPIPIVVDIQSGDSWGDHLAPNVLDLKPA